MAENKKSFVLYCDLIHTVRKMPKDKAGELFMTILSYVNDENPEIGDQLVDLVFEPVRQQLKRDLKKWERYISKQSSNGKKGGRPKTQPFPDETQKTQPFPDETQKTQPFPDETQKTQALNGKPKKADNVNVSVSVSDSVNVAATAAAELGIETVRKVSNEAWKDQGWRETLCMGLGITMPELKKWMALFNSSVSNDRIEGVFDKARYGKMCQGWILYQKSKGVKIEHGLEKTSNAPPLTTIKP